MIYSMTGDGKSVALFQDKKICVEIRSLNGKAMDLSTRMAPQYKAYEMDIRAMITGRLERGKVDFALYIEQSEKADTPSLNVAVMQSYLEQMRTAAEATGVAMPENAMELLLRLPDVVTRKEVYEVGEDEWQIVREAVEKAIEELMDFRRQEGDALSNKFRKNIERIGELLVSVEPYEKERVEKIRARIVDNLQKMVGIEYDSNRLEQELIYYIEKLDVNEEKQRLTNHLEYFIEIMNGPIGQGKKLGFIAQEMGREINTLGSKSNNAQMQNIVVMMKDELEQIKEQVLNVM